MTRSMTRSTTVFYGSFFATLVFASAKSIPRVSVGSDERDIPRIDPRPGRGLVDDQIYTSNFRPVERARLDPDLDPTSIPTSSSSPHPTHDPTLDFTPDPTTSTRRRLVAEDASSLDDSGGSEGGVPPLRGEVFAYVDGLGVRGSSRLLDGLGGGEGGEEVDFTVTRETFDSVDGDTWRVTEAYQDGLGGFYRRCVSRGVPFGLVTTKCADDGTSSGFLVETNDRYDLRGVSESISRLRPSPYLVSGGFSRSLFEATSREVANPTPPSPRGFLSHVLNAYGVDERLETLDRVGESRTVPGVVEFDTSGTTAYGETCEYPATSSLSERAVRGVRKGVEAARSSPRRSFFMVLVVTTVDSAAHARNDTRFSESIETMRLALASVVREMRATCGEGGWRLTIVGSHATGGGGSVAAADGDGGTGLHGRHSPAGTPIPYARVESTSRSTRRRPPSPVDEVTMFSRFARIPSPTDDDVNTTRTIVPGVRWKGLADGRSTTTNETDGSIRHHQHHHHRYRDARGGRPLTFWEAYVNVLLLVFLFGFVPCCLCAAASSGS